MLPVRRLLKNTHSATATAPDIVFGDNNKRAVSEKPKAENPVYIVGKSLDVEKVGQAALKENSLETNIILETASGAGAADGVGNSMIRSRNVYGSILDEFIYTDIDAIDPIQLGKNKDTSLNRIYRDIYYHDPICGGGIDMLSYMPWSDFTLGGAKTDKTYEKYYNSTANMNVNKLMPHISSEYFVYGLFCGTTIFNKDEGEYNGIIPQQADYVEVLPVPIFGRDPLINLMVGEAAKSLMQTDDPRMKQYADLIPKNTDKLQPDPNDIMYITRRALMRDVRGTSILRRLLTSWLLERALYRGTLDQSMKRQRSITHLMLGDTDWTPTQDEMAQMASNLVGADLDPVGAIFVTRTGVSVNDIRSANDLWKVTDLTDFFTSNKLRALGISEAFLNGEYSVNALDQAMSVFVENMRAFRDMMTYEVFYDKTFPNIAKANDFMRKRVGLEMADVEEYRRQEHTQFLNMLAKGRPSLRGVDRNQLNLFGDNSYLFDKAEMSREERNELFIPEVHWLKRLRPEADDQYLGMLNTVSQAGLPIPLRLYAAAAGLNMDSIENQMKDDMELREKFKPWIKKTQPEGEGAPGGGGGESGLDLSHVTESKHRRVGVFNREYDPEIFGPKNIVGGGKRKLLSKKGRDIMDEKINKAMAETAAKLGARINAIEKQQEELFMERNSSTKHYT